MTARAEQLQTFLTLAGWGQAKRRPLAGDASNRRYERLAHSNGTRAVLMDAPPSKGEDIAPFIKLAEYLSRSDLSAPDLFARDVHNGFLLLEDLGDDLFARVLEDDLTQEAKLYAAATDTLIDLHIKAPPKSLQHYGPDIMAEAACLALDWYATHADGPVSAADRAILHDLVHTQLEETFPQKQVTVLRDYHAENLLWLPNRAGLRRVGLLDFQDAMLGHPAYDLASLLHDARRDVSDATRTACIERYVSATGHPKETFALGYAACSAQRNLRIMGVFARLCIRDGKPGYPDLMPRVWANLTRDLAHPDLSDLAGFVENHIPEPTPQIIAKIKSHHA
ncbi:MAG: phosphotransferase [Pseudomonadota bacterium]